MDGLENNFFFFWSATLPNTLGGNYWENARKPFGTPFLLAVLPPRARARSYRVGDIVFVVAAVAPFQRQVAGEPQLVALHGIADVLEEFGLDARPVGAAVVQELAAELE